MATLTITQDEDFRGDRPTNIDSFLFQTADPSAQAIFSAAASGSHCKASRERRLMAHRTIGVTSQGCPLGVAMATPLLA
jgi:hypothetical protein